MTNIAHYRKLRGLKQAQLAELVDVTQPHMSRIENGDETLPRRLSVTAALAGLSFLPRAGAEAPPPSGYR